MFSELISIVFIKVTMISIKYPKQKYELVSMSLNVVFRRNLLKLDEKVML